MNPDLIFPGLTILGLLGYIIYLHHVIDKSNAIFNDIYDRIQQWRKAGSTDHDSFWLLSDISGIIRRYMRYPDAPVSRSVQRSVDEEDSGE